MATANAKGGFLTLLQKKNFLRLWLAQLISMTVLNASNYALIILIEEITGSTTLIGLAIICFSLPAVLFGAPAGVFVDHRNKRRVLWYSNCLRAIATVGFVVSLISDNHQLVTVYLLTLLISSIGQFFTPAEGASIPMLVSEEELMPALSLFNVTFMLSNALGFILFAPILLSFLPSFTLFNRIPITPIEMLYFIIAVLYLICAFLIISIPPGSFKEPQRTPAGTSPAGVGEQAIGVLQNVWNEMRQGWSFIRRNPLLFQAVIQLSFAGVLLLVIGELATPLVTNLLGLPATSMAFVFAPAGIGLVLGSIVMPRITERLGKLRTIFTGSMALAVTILLLPLSTLLAHFLEQHGLAVNTLLVIVVAMLMFLAGVGIDLITIPAQTALQEQTPDWIKGRVLALQLMLYNACSIPIILFIGAIADIFKLSNVIYFISVCIAAFGFWGVYYQRKSHSRKPESPSPTPSEKEAEADRVGS